MSKVVQGKAVSRKRSDPPCRRNGLHCYRLCSSVPTKIPTLARRSCVRKDRNCTRRNLVAVLVMPRYAIPLGMARRKAKNWPPGAVSTGNTKYSSGAIAINGGGFNELEVAPLALITWSHTKMTSSGFGDVVRQPVQGRGVPRILRVWRFPHSPHSRRFSGNLQSLRLIITVWRVKPRRRERIGTH